MRSSIELKSEADRFYRELVNHKHQIEDLHDKIKKTNGEISKLEEQWKKDVSQNTFKKTIKSYLPKQAKPISNMIINHLYKDIPETKHNAMTFNYIEKLKAMVDSYKNDILNIEKQIQNKQIILRRIEAELRSLGC